VASVQVLGLDSGWVGAEDDGIVYGNGTQVVRRNS